MKFKMDFYKLSKRVLVLVFLINTIGIQSQINFKSLKFHLVKENIFQRPITSMVMDTYGFIWIGTDGAGLYKFNGFSYTYYGHDLKDANSINSNSISSLFIDASGQLWIGTNAGLCMYDNRQNSFKRFEIKTVTKTDDSYPNIVCIAQYKDELLVGTVNRGIKKIDVKNRLIKNYGLHKTTVNDLKFSTKGDLYIATEEGLKLELIHNKGAFESIPLSNKNSASEHITKLHLDQRENLWVGTLKSGMFKSDLKKTRTSFDALAIAPQRVMDIVSGMDHVFISVENEGLVIMDMNGKAVKHYQYDAQDSSSIASNSAWSLLLDNENRLWLGYYENGLGFFDKYHNKFKSIQKQDVNNSFQINNVKAFAKTDDGKIWIAQNNKIDILNTNSGEIVNVFGKSTTDYKGLKREIYVEGIFVDSKGNTWIATWGHGIFLLKKGSKTFQNFTMENTAGVLLTDKIRCFTEDELGNVWIGSHLGGVYYFNSKKGKIEIPIVDSVENTKIAKKDIKVIFHDSFGAIWVGTSSGLYHIESQKEKGYVVIWHGNALSSKFGGHPSSQRILDIYETQDGIVWYGTNGGLFYLHREKQDFERFELPDYDLTYVNAIFEPVKSELWVSSKMGILKIKRDTKEVVQFTSDDGLLENFLIDRGVIMDNNDRFYLGTKNGVNVIEPQDIKYNPYLVKPYLKDVRIFNKKTNQKEKGNYFDVTKEMNLVTLQHGQTILTIDYEAISYTRPEKKQYAYFLEGFENTWNYVGSKTSATYTNLDSGEYTFKLKASNNDNKWDEAATVLKIKVLPPWWKTFWAYLIFLLLLALMIFLATYLYRKRVNERNSYRLERERRKQKVELQQQKLQFFTNISHEFRTPLTLIINPIKELIELDEADFSASVRQKHLIIHKNAERLSRLINELMDFRKLQSNKLRLRINQFNLIDHAKRILSFFNEESKRRSIRLDLKYESANLDLWADSGMLDKIFFNLLSNAFKVTPNEGRIQVSIISGSKKILPLISKEVPIPVIEIHVKDNGPGIDQKDYKKIFKRFYQISELNKSYYGSTGVGLEMVKSFIELHKGVIEVESELGKGSVFKISIPYGKEFFGSAEDSSVNLEKQSELTEFEPKSKPEIYKIEEILSKKEIKKRLLIVEDNIDLQDYLVSILEQDYELLLASDGQEGWFKTMEHRPDIIITDIIMPLMDGMEFSKKVKNNPDLNQIPIVILTAKDLAKDRIKGMEVGAEAYLVKPFDAKELKVVLEQLLLKKEHLLEQYANVPLDHQAKKEKDLDNDFIQRAVSFIQENIEDTSLNVEKLSSHLCLSRSQVYRKIKTLTSLSPVEFIRRVRLEKSRTLFQNNKNINVSEVAHKVGFLSASYFTVCYKKQYGELPKTKR